MVWREGEMDQQQKPGEVRGIIGNGGLGLPYKQTLPAVRMSTYIAVTAVAGIFSKAFSSRERLLREESKVMYVTNFIMTSDRYLSV